MRPIRLGAFAAAVMLLSGCGLGAGPEQPVLGLKTKSAIETDGLKFRDLDSDGALSAYEDWRKSPEHRAQDLVGRMTLAEKVGTLVHATLPGQGGLLGRADGYDLDASRTLVSGKHITSFITRLASEPAELARQNNAIQELGEATRLGIPITISTDPRNHFQYVLGASEGAGGVSQWPELLGFAALRDPALVKQFGDIARKEYRAVGIHMALSPQLDLLTEPRWGRGSGTFGSSADLTSELGGAYVAGFQGSDRGLAPDGVMTVVKHWVGYGAQPEGFDAHNYYGRFARPDRYFDQHIAAFSGALAAGAAGVMPAYPILIDTTLGGQPIEQVGAGYSKQLLGELLRGREKFGGIILSDWAITNDCPEPCRNPTAQAPQLPQHIATSWGVEHLTVAQRYAKGLDAGIDQFGGTEDVQSLMQAVSDGLVSEARLDESVVRILVPKFTLGLFENPYVDPDDAAAQVGAAADLAFAEETQRAAQVLLQNEGATLPIRSPRRSVWLHGMDPKAAQQAGLTVVADLADADFAIVRTETPSEMLHPHHFFGSRYKEGRLDFRDGDPAYEALKRANAAGVPAVLAIFLDRPAILTNVQDKAAVILANFGASDAAVLDVILGKAQPKGRLPVELPRSMRAVEAQHPGAPDDSVDPLYPFGAGLSLTGD